MPLKSRLVQFLTLVAILSLLQPLRPAQAAVTLSIEPITWNVVGLDSKDVNAGPNQFPVGARVCNLGDTAATGLVSSFAWDSADPYINLRPGSLSSHSRASLAAGECVDFYYEVEISRDPAAYDRTRRYRISVNSSEFGPVSTPTRREIYVERLVSQNRNSVLDVKLDGLSIGAGGMMALVVGETYDIQLDAATASSGYNQLETFITLPNTVFRINSVTSTYSATSLPSPHDSLYADSCGWEDHPLSLNYRSCLLSDGKSGGNVSVNYNVTVLGGAGTARPMNTVIYDFSGGSYHFNGDFSTTSRYLTVVKPVVFSKRFSPVSITAGGTSRLTFTLENPNATTLQDLSFSDNLPSTPGQMYVANPPNANTAGCGTPTLTAVAGATSLAFSSASVAPGGTCTASVDVTAPVNGIYRNTSLNLFSNSLDTGLSASASLVVEPVSSGSSSVCGITMAKWEMDPSQGTGVPPPPFILAPDVPSAEILTSPGVTQTIDTGTGSAAPYSWKAYGFTESKSSSPVTDTHIILAVDTSNFSGVSLSFNLQRQANGPRELDVYFGNSPTPVQTFKTNISVTDKWAASPVVNFTGQTNPSGITYFFFYPYHTYDVGGGGHLFLDDITFTGCRNYQDAALAKSFSPGSIPQGGTSTLTFTLTNPNSVALTGAAFSDPLPGGLQVASPANAGTTCSGASFAPAPGDALLSFSGGTIPAGGSCTVQVDVTAASPGLYQNDSGFITTFESGTNTGAGGSAAATLTVLAPPGFDKAFAPNPIYAGDTTTLRFTLTNPNSTYLDSAAFSDALPAGLQVATPANASTTCSGASFAPAPGDTSLSFSAGTIPAYGSCTAQVDLIAPATGYFTNTSSALSTGVAGLSGDPAIDTLAVVDLHPGLRLLKQVASAPSGPWTNFILVSPGNDVYYRFMVENSGDVDLTSVSLSDPSLDLTGCPLTAPFSLAVADPLGSCTVGPFPAQAGSVINTAAATGSYGGSDYTSGSSAEYLGVAMPPNPDLSLVKQIGPSADGPWLDSIADIPTGTDLYYRFLVANSGDTTLSGLSIVDPDVSTAACELLDPIDTSRATQCIVGPVAALPGTHTNTAQALSTVPALSSLSDTATYSAGYYDITGQVWYDANADGVVDGGEAGLEGVVLSLYLDDGDGIFELDQDSLIEDQITGASGDYLFLEILEGSYFLYVSDGVSAYLLVSGGPNPRPATLSGADSSGNNFGYRYPQADLAITKTNGAVSVQAGGTTAYTIRVDNNGPAAASGAILSDTSGAGLAAAQVVCSAAAGNQCAVDPLLADLTGAGTSLPALDAGGFYEIVLTVDVTASSGSVENTASIAPPAGIVDPAAGNNSATDSDTVDPTAELAITKTNGASSVQASGTTAYTIRVTNNGPSVAIGSVLTDTPGTGLAATQVVCSPAAGNRCTSAPDLANLTGAGVNLPTLNPGQFYEITLSVDVSAVGGSITNTASVALSAGIFDPSLSNNTAVDTDNVDPTVDLAIAKTNGASSVQAGGTTTYTIRVANGGPSTASGVTLKDSPGAGLNPTRVECSSAAGNRCAEDPVLTDLTGVGVSLPDLAPAQFFEIQLEVEVTASSGWVSNSASLDLPAGALDPNPVNNSAADTDSVGPTADLSITKTNSAAAIQAGGTTTYTIRATNNGPSSVTGATLSDSLGPGLQATQVVCSPAPSNRCTAAPNLASLTGAGISLPALDAGGFYEVLLTANLTAVSGSVRNTASVAPPAGVLDPVLDNNSATDTDVVGLTADLAVTKTDGTAAVRSGDATTYTIRVTNNGPSSASGVMLRDQVGAGLAATQVSCSPAPGNRCAVTPNLASLTGAGIGLPALISGQFFEILLTAQVNAADGTVTNTASLVLTAGILDPDLGNNSATDTDGVNLSADLAVTKTDGASSVQAGGSTAYTIRATNNGPSSVTGARLSDSLGPGLQATQVVCSPAPGNRCTAAPNLASLTGAGISLPTLASGGFYEVLLTANVTAASGSVRNTVTSEPPAGVLDPDLSNNTAADTDSVVPGSEITVDLSLTKSDGISTVLAQGLTTYTIRVTNNGPDSAVGALLSDEMGAGLVANLVNCSPAAGNRCGQAPNLAALSGSGISLPDLDAGQFYEFLLTVRLTVDSGTVTNTASVAVPGLVDSRPEDNTAADTNEVVTGNYRAYLPVISHLVGVAPTEWKVNLAYEDLSIESGKNDFDYNDWVVEVESTVTYTSPGSNEITALELSFLPKAYGGNYEYKFEVLFPAGTFSSDGTATLTTYDANHQKIGLRTFSFVRNKGQDFRVFPLSTRVFPRHPANTVESEDRLAAQEVVELRLEFDHPIQFNFPLVDHIQLHGQGLFFEPILTVQDYAQRILVGDVRLLVIPAASWSWPEEKVRIDRAYPQVVFISGNPPSLAFPDNWWTTHNECVYDGRTCQQGYR
jgi:uncharacterized repeat protein (TIGR01451 family)